MDHNVDATLGIGILNLIGHMLLFVDSHGRKQCVKTMHGCSKEAKRKLG